MIKVERDRVARAARMYRTSKEAGMALGIAPQSFCRLCRTYGIVTPAARRRRRYTSSDGRTGVAQPEE